MKLRLHCLVVALLFVAVCFSGCKNSKTKVGSTGSDDKSSAIETVSQNVSTDSESEDASFTDASSLNSEEKQKTEAPLIPKQQVNSKESGLQDQTNQTNEQEQEPQQNIEPEDDIQSAASADPYEGAGY